jgi:hypothetical protein
MSRFVRRSRFAIIFAASVIASPEFAQENAQEKSHDLTSFFSGNLIATGQFSDYLGRSTRGLQVEIHGAPDGGVFKLVEDATYSDGEKKKWDWRFSKDSEGRYVGWRADLIGEAKVEAHGDKIEITYRAHVPMKDGNIQDLNFAETFIFTQAGTADYQLRVSLLFVPVAEAHLTVRKLGCCTDNGDKRPWQAEPQPSPLR